MNNKIILCFNSHLQKDLVIDPETDLEAIDQDGNPYTIKAKDSLKKKAGMPIDFTNLYSDDQFDKELVKFGYATAMPHDSNKGRQIKLPKKETELRELFGLDDKGKASFWTKDYDNKYIGDLTTDKEKFSFLRGLYSAKARLVPGSKGYVVCNTAKIKFNCNYEDEFTDNFCDGGHYEYNSSNMFYQTREELYFLIKNIGVVQKEKLELIIKLYREHLLIVSKILPVDNTYLLNYVKNYGDEKDYTDELAQKYDLNCKDPKTKDTPLHIALDNKKKHNSIYPVVWLLQNGADVDAVNKKGELCRKLLQERYNNWYYNPKNQYINYLLERAFENNPKILTEKQLEFMIKDSYNWVLAEKVSHEELVAIFSTLNKNYVLHAVFKYLCNVNHQCGRFNLKDNEDIEEKDLKFYHKDNGVYTTIIEKLIKHSTENIDEIMMHLLQVFKGKLDQYIQPFLSTGPKKMSENEFFENGFWTLCFIPFNHKTNR